MIPDQEAMVRRPDGYTNGWLRIGEVPDGFDLTHALLAVLTDIESAVGGFVNPRLTVSVADGAVAVTFSTEGS